MKSMPWGSMDATTIYLHMVYKYLDVKVLLAPPHAASAALLSAAQRSAAQRSAYY